MAANYFDTQLLGFTGRVTPRFNKPELRELKSEVLSVGLKNQDYLDGVMVEDIKETLYRPVYADQLVRKQPTNGTTFTAFDTSGIQGTSQRTAITWVGFTEAFQIYITTGQDNDLKWQMLWDNEMQQTQRILRERLRVWLMGQLHTGRTAGGNVTAIPNGLGVWNPATNAYEINDQSQFFSKMKQIMAINKYYGKDAPIDIFADNVLFPQYEFTVAQGANNAVNTTYQFQNGITNVFMDTLLGQQVAEEYTNGMALVLPANSFAIIPFLPRIFTNPKPGEDASHFSSYDGGYGVISDGQGYGRYDGNDDMTEPLQYGVHGWATQYNNSGNNGSAVDKQMNFQVGLYFAFQGAVISNANETPIFEFGYTG